MTKQEIQERNKQIALMLGWKYSFAHKVDQYGYYQTVDGYSTPYINTLDEQALEYQSDKNAFAVEDLQFHSDWNWLMEAVEFIENLQSDNFYMEFFWLNGPNVSLYQKDNQKGLILWETHGRFKNVETKKEAVFITVSDFAKLYNNKEL
jgi:hypothetical protein